MKFHSLFALLLLASALPAHAEQAVQELEYRSVFEGYQAYADPEIQNWPKANQLVEEIGGWRVYAREPYENSAKDKPTDSKEPAQPHSHQHGGAR
jgi:hypothetical protein